MVSVFTGLVADLMDGCDPKLELSYFSKFELSFL